MLNKGAPPYIFESCTVFHLRNSLFLITESKSNHYRTFVYGVISVFKRWHGLFNKSFCGEAEAYFWCTI